VKPQGVRAESLGILEFAARTKLRRDRDFEEFEGKTRVKSPHRNQAQKEDTSYLARSIKNLNGRLKFSEGELPIFSWTVGSSGSTKKLRLSVFQHS
jgi:hypothetical protein